MGCKGAGEGGRGERGGGAGYGKTPRAWDDAALGHATRSLTRNRRTPTLWPSSCLCRGRPLLFLGGRGIGLQAHSLSPSLTRPLSPSLTRPPPCPLSLSHSPLRPLPSSFLALSHSRALALSRSRVLLLSLALSPSLALSRPPPHRPTQLATICATLWGAGVGGRTREERAGGGHRRPSLAGPTIYQASNATISSITRDQFAVSEPLSSALMAGWLVTNAPLPSAPCSSSIPNDD